MAHRLIPRRLKKYGFSTKHGHMRAELESILERLETNHQTSITFYDAETGKKSNLSLKRLREALLVRDAYRSMPATVLENLLKQARGFERWQQMNAMRQKGETIDKIAETFSTTPKTVQANLEGKRFPRTISMKEYAWRMQNRKPFRLKPETRNDYFYLLGATFGNLGLFTQKGRTIGFEMNVKSRPFAEAVQRAAKRLLERGAFKITPSKTKDEYMLAITSANFLQHVFKTTAYGEKVPSFKLHNREEKTAFLKGLFDSNGTPPLKSNKTGHVKLVVKREKVRNAALSILHELGFEAHAYNINKQYGLQLSSPYVQAFAKRIGFRDPKKQQRFRTSSARL